MSDTTVIPGPTVKPSDKSNNFYSNGKIADQFFQKELLPLSSEEAILVMVLEVIEERVRVTTNRETGELQKWAPQTKIKVAGGLDILLKGVGYKDLPPEEQFALFQVEQVKNDFGVKLYLKKWRAVDDIRALTDFKPVGLPLLYNRQLICSTVLGADYLRIGDEILTTVEQIERVGK